HAVDEEAGPPRIVGDVRDGAGDALDDQLEPDVGARSEAELADAEPNGPWICSTSSANGALGSKARRAAADAVGWNASGLVSMRSARCSTSLDLRAPPNPEKMAESSSLTTLWRFLASLRSTVNSTVLRGPCAWSARLS